ncbi:MAG TPA: universal stress protein [Elusimicrobiota bacterium]|nr:universal stress protein [Elusimicrobiota bacterium]
MARNHVPRVPPKKILVPLDVTDASVAAWKQAAILGQRFAATVEGLYVQEWLNAAVGVGMGLGPEPFLTAKAKKEALDFLRGRLGQNADIRLVEGPVEGTIVSWGRRLGFDLIVMGTHGYTGIERAIKGSVAEAVVRHSDIPVLVVKKPLSNFKTVLAPVNLAPYSIKGLHYAAQMSAVLGARLKILYVLNSPLPPKAGAVKDAKHLLEKAVAKLPEPLRRVCGVSTQLDFGRSADGIAAAARKADLVVLAAHRKGFLSEVVLGTTVGRVMRHCASLVLAVPTGEVKR